MEFSIFFFFFFIILFDLHTNMKYFFFFLSSIEILFSNHEILIDRLEWWRNSLSRVFVVYAVVRDTLAKRKFKGTASRK